MTEREETEEKDSSAELHIVLLFLGQCCRTLLYHPCILPHISFRQMSSSKRLMRYVLVVWLTLIWILCWGLFNNFEKSSMIYLPLLETWKKKCRWKKSFHHLIYENTTFLISSHRRVFEIIHMQKIYCSHKVQCKLGLLIFKIKF